MCIVHVPVWDTMAYYMYKCESLMQVSSGGNEAGVECPTHTFLISLTIISLLSNMVSLTFVSSLRTPEELLLPIELRW